MGNINHYLCTYICAVYTKWKIVGTDYQSWWRSPLKIYLIHSSADFLTSFFMALRPVLVTQMNSNFFGVYLYRNLASLL